MKWYCPGQLRKVYVPKSLALELDSASHLVFKSGSAFVSPDRQMF